MAATWQPTTAAELEEIISSEIADCPSDLQDFFARCRIPLRAVPILRYGEFEHVFLVAQCGDVFVYYEDVEEGFNLSTLTADGSISSPGFEQWELRHALVWLASSHFNQADVASPRSLSQALGLMNTYQHWKELGRPIDYLMECWLASQSSDAEAKEENGWAVMEPSDEARDNPERAWECILFATADSRFTDAHVGLLAAGTLEDLLSFHGQDFIERVELQAKINPRFAWMLGGVWQFQMSEEIWKRVQSVWDRRGWDGIPAEA